MTDATYNRVLAKQREAREATDATRKRIEPLVEIAREVCEWPEVRKCVEVADMCVVVRRDLEKTVFRAGGGGVATRDVIVTHYGPSQAVEFFALDEAIDWFLNLVASMIPDLEEK